MKLPDPYYRSPDGAHVLYCADCMSILPLLEPGSVDAVVTDPPYGVSHRPGVGRMVKKGGGIYGDAEPPDIRFVSGYEAVVWGGNNFCDQLPRSTGWLVWDKTHCELCEHSQAELAWTNTVRTIRLHRQAYHGFMRQRDGWFHQHQKPIELMEWCIRFTAGQTILDPFAGSGTTAVACVRTGRKSISIEKEPKYCEIAKRRIEEALGVGSLFCPIRNEQPDLFACPPESGSLQPSN